MEQTITMTLPATSSLMVGFVAGSAAGASDRVTEADEARITEDGEQRITE